MEFLNIFILRHCYACFNFEVHVAMHILLMDIKFDTFCANSLSSLNAVERNTRLCIEASVLVDVIMLEKSEVAKFIFPSFVV